MNVIVHPEAERELIEAADYYDRQRVGLGAELLAAIEKGIARIVADPERFCTLDTDCRFCRVDRFPYGVIYRSIQDTIWILAFRHHSRDADYWKSRR